MDGWGSARLAWAIIAGHQAMDAIGFLAEGRPGLAAAAATVAVVAGINVYLSHRLAREG